MSRSLFRDGDAIIVATPNGSVAFLSPMAARLTGWNAADAIGQRVECVYRLSDSNARHPISCLCGTIRNGGEPSEGNLLLAKDGQVRLVRHQTSTLRDEQGGMTGSVLVFWELPSDGSPSTPLAAVTHGSEERPCDCEQRVERSCAHDPLQEGQRQSLPLHQLAQASCAITAVHRTEDVLQEITHRAREIIPAHLAVTSLTLAPNWAQAIQTVSLSDKYAVWRNYRALPDGSGIYSLVCQRGQPMRLTQAQLESHPAWRGFGSEAERHPPLRGWLAAPLTDRDGHTCGLIQLSDRWEGEFTADDESILVQLARLASVAIENARLYESLQEGKRRTDEFLATLGHELRNPLASMLHAVHLLDADVGTADQKWMARNAMRHQVRHMKRLVDDLLDATRFTTGKIRLHLARTRLQDVLERAVADIQPVIKGNEQQLIQAIPQRPLWLQADAVRLEQVLGNLLRNAAKYTPEGGCIWLSVREQARRVILRVRDNGMGMSPELLPRVFELFSQAERSLERSQGGLGIGLALVKSLVEQHGGTVEARSEGVGRGSEFTIRLPLAPSLEESTPAPREQMEFPPLPRRVLVVDDHRESAELCALLLQSWGHEVQTAHNGPDALRCIAEYNPHIILLDIGLPDMDGLEVARRIRRDHADQEIIIVAITGYGQREDRLRSEAAGINLHLVKPVEADELQQLLATSAPPFR